MAQITLRVPDDLLDRIDEQTGPETSRSEWLRQAARARLSQTQSDDLRPRLAEVEDRLDRVEDHIEKPLWERVFESPD